MAVKIRLLRMGKIRNPQYRIVIADSRTKRDGRAIEQIGLYHPKEDPSRIEVNSERAQYWLSVGAQPSEPVIAILSRTGDWQKFKGLPPPSEPLKVAAARVDRTATYEAEAKVALGLAEAAKPKREPQKAQPAKATRTAKADAPKAAAASPAAAADATAAGATVAEATAAEATAADVAAAEATVADATAADVAVAEATAADVATSAPAEPVEAEEQPSAGTDPQG